MSDKTINQKDIVSYENIDGDLVIKYINDEIKIPVEDIKYMHYINLEKSKKFILESLALLVMVLSFIFGYYYIITVVVEQGINLYSVLNLALISMNLSFIYIFVKIYVVSKRKWYCYIKTDEISVYIIGSKPNDNIKEVNYNILDNNNHIHHTQITNMYKFIKELV